MKKDDIKYEAGWIQMCHHHEQEDSFIEYFYSARMHSIDQKWQ